MQWNRRSATAFAPAVLLTDAGSGSDERGPGGGE